MLTEYCCGGLLDSSISWWSIGCASQCSVRTECNYSVDYTWHGGGLTSCEDCGSIPTIYLPLTYVSHERGTPPPGGSASPAPTFTATPSIEPQVERVGVNFAGCIAEETIITIDQSRRTQQRSRLLYNNAGQVYQNLSDTNDDGIFDIIRCNTYHDQSRIWQTRSYTSVDCMITGECIYEYSNKRLIATRCDSDGDTILDTIENYVYSEDGNLFTKSFSVLNDDVGSFRSFYAYDNQGRLAKESFDEGDDGSFDFEYIYSWNNGRVAIITRRFIIEDIPERVMHFSYNVAGQLVEVVTISESGRVDRRTTYEYSGDNLVRKLDYEGGGLLRTTSVYEYHNNRIVRITDTDPRYSIQRITEYAYECD